MGSDGIKRDRAARTRRICFIPGNLEAEIGARDRGAGLARQLHFASHLRTERLGEFTAGTDLRRSECLAVIQMLVLYHLFTATASVALGGQGTRVARAGEHRYERLQRRLAPDVFVVTDGVPWKQPSVYGYSSVAW